jgi:hypothetical protein
MIQPAYQLEEDCQQERHPRRDVWQDCKGSVPYKPARDAVDGSFIDSQPKSLQAKPRNN